MARCLVACSLSSVEGPLSSQPTETPNIRVDRTRDASCFAFQMTWVLNLATVSKTLQAFVVLIPCVHGHTPPANTSRPASVAVVLL